MQDRIRTGARRAAALIAIAALAACEENPKPPTPPTPAPEVSCLPVKLTTPTVSAKRVQVYLDRSFSMVGYVRPQNGSIALADLLTLVEGEGGTRKLSVGYTAFGEKLAPLADAAAAEGFATPAPYECTGCDNQQSLINETLKDVAANGDDALNIVVTDLWLDDKSYRGSFDTAVGEPLRELLAAGKAVGVLGVNAPYSGAIYDIPGTGIYRDATRRPLFVLLIGSTEEVSAAYRLLARSPLLSGEHARYTLFTAAPIARAITPRLAARGGGVSQGVAFKTSQPTREFRMNVGTAETQKGMIVGTLMAESEGAGLPPGLTWNGTLGVGARWWGLKRGASLSQCAADMWVPVAQSPNPWSGKPSGKTVAFKLDSRVRHSLMVPGSYLMLGELNATGLYPNPAADWMAEWSVDDDSIGAFVASRPGSFKAYKLARLRKIMDDQLVALDERPRALVRFPLILTLQP